MPLQAALEVRPTDAERAQHFKQLINAAGLRPDARRKLSFLKWKPVWEAHIPDAGERENAAATSQRPRPDGRSAAPGMIALRLLPIGGGRVTRRTKDASFVRSGRICR